MKHYLVVSDEIVKPSSIIMEEPDYFRCCCVVEAETKKEALKKAYRHTDMQEWIEEARNDMRNPFSGMTVTEADKCPHGVCMCGCVVECFDCDEEMKATIDLILPSRNE